MIKNLKIFILLTCAAICSCTQPEGLGGNSHIKGVLIERFYNEDFSVLQTEEPAKDEDVFLLFGDDLTVGEKTSTSYSGNFQFEYLWPGKYTLYFLSDDSLSTTPDKKETKQEIILEKNTTANLDTMYMNTVLDWNEGSATIKGKVRMINYVNESKYPNLEIKDIGPAQDIDVYLIYNNHSIYDERIRTMGDGSFTFPNLLKGKYQVFLYSDDVKGNTEMIVKSFEVTINEINQTIDLETITIDKH